MEYQAEFFLLGQKSLLLIRGSTIIVNIGNATTTKKIAVAGPFFVPLAPAQRQQTIACMSSLPPSLPQAEEDEEEWVALSFPLFFPVCPYNTRPSVGCFTVWRVPSLPLSFFPPWCILYNSPPLPFCTNKKIWEEAADAFCIGDKSDLQKNTQLERKATGRGSVASQTYLIEWKVSSSRGELWEATEEIPLT